MADIVRPEVRSRMMSAIRGKNTSPEMLIRRLLHREGFRYRLHIRSLPGKPDLVFSALRAVIFVHGCYWHGHDCPAFKLPQTNRVFWRAKLMGNRRRDQQAIKSLSSQGWRVLVVWECATRGLSEIESRKLLRRISAWLKSGDGFLEIRS